LRIAKLKNSEKLIRTRISDHPVKYLFVRELSRFADNVVWVPFRRLHMHPESFKPPGYLSMEIGELPIL
jgi:hypothetical protein